MIKADLSKYEVNPVTPTWVEPQPYIVEKGSERVNQVGLQVLLEETHDNVEENVSYFREVIRVLNIRGAEALLTRAIHYCPSYQQIIMHTIRIFRENVWHDRLVAPVCTVEDPKECGEVLTFFLSDIRVGDIFERSFSKVTYHKYFTHRYHSIFYFNDDVSLDKSFFRIVFDPKRSITSKVLHGQAARMDKDLSNGLKAYSWEKERTIIEDDPDWKKGSECVQVSEFQSWKEIVNKKLPHYSLPPDFLPSGEMRKLVKEWKNLPDILQQATAATRFVQDEICYLDVEGDFFGQKPAHPNDTLQKRWGSCRDKVFLLHAFFKLMGINSWCVSISTSSFEYRKMILPALEFNHVILKANINGKEYWIDTTDSEIGPLKETTRLDKLWGLVLSPETEDIIDIPQVKLERCNLNVATEFEFESPTKIKMFIRTIYQDYEADDMRYLLSKKSLIDIKAEHLGIFRRKYGEVKIKEDFKVEDDKQANKIVTAESYYIFLDKQKGNGSFRFTPLALGYLDKNVDPQSTKTHDLGSPKWVREIVIITNPSQKQSLPLELQVNNTHFYYGCGNLKFEDSNTRAWRLDYVQKKTEVEPSEKQAYVDDVTKILNSGLSIKIKQPDQQS